VEPQDRDDLLQEMMLALWHAVPAFRRQIATEVLEEPISVAVSNG
jgi:DNA-directed RNA polymerase specialized sigma24 family protein